VGTAASPPQKSELVTSGTMTLPPQSVTSTPCTCRYLEQAASDPENPISFDRRYGCYQFIYTEPGTESPSMLVIYHCPFCGGAAPRSQPEQLFHLIPSHEQDRLLETLAPLKSIDMAIKSLGTPSLDTHSRQRTFEQDGSPPAVRFARVLTYDDLSETARVEITERDDGGIVFQMIGKPRDSSTHA
jgi:hypothetical protein